MIKYDEDFLARVGLSDLPVNQKPIFLEHVREELEIRVGERISENMTEEQISEFEGIMKKDPAIMRSFLSQIGDYKQDEVFLKMVELQGEKKIDAQFVSDFLSVKWIHKNRPDYKEVVSEEATRLEKEIYKSKEEILAIRF